MSWCLNLFISKLQLYHVSKMLQLCLALLFKHQQYVIQLNSFCSVSGASKAFVELPPELCSIIMSPITDSIIYSFSFIPAIMHRLESLLGAFNLKNMHLDHCMQNEIQTIKVCYNCSTLQSGKVHGYALLFFRIGNFISFL